MVLLGKGEGVLLLGRSAPIREGCSYKGGVVLLGKGCSY